MDAIASEMTSERIQPLATAWEQFGDHRTGTPAERQSALWLEKLLLIHGVPASTQVYSLQRMSDPRAHIEVNGVVIDGFPLSDGGTTGGVDWDSDFFFRNYRSGWFAGGYVEKYISRPVPL